MPDTRRLKYDKQLASDCHPGRRPYPDRLRRRPAPGRLARHSRAASRPAAPTSAWTATDTPAATATPEVKARPADLYAHFPRNPDGRLIGLQASPILNYSPTMVMGRPCPRVKRWGVRKVTPQPPAQPYYYVVDNPCVIQNALDDGLRALFYWPSGYPDQEYYRREIVPLLKSDPVAQWALHEISRRNFAEKLGGGYALCDKPTYTLIDTDAGVPLAREPFAERPSGRRFFVRLIEAAGQAEPFTCKVYRRSTGELWHEYALRESDMDQPISDTDVAKEFMLNYDPQTGRWQGALFNSEPAPVLNYRERVLFLLEQSPVKP